MDTTDKMNMNPTVDIRDVIALIRAHYKKDEIGFKNASREIATQLEKQGASQLAHYVWGEIGDEPVWVPMDEDTTKINLKAQLEEIDKLTELLDVKNCDGLPEDKIPEFAVSHSRVAVHIRRIVKQCLEEFCKENQNDNN